MRRGSIAINVIVIAALALLVLVILAIMVSNSTQKADSTINNCEGLYAGSCNYVTDSCIRDGGRVITGVDCGDPVTGGGRTLDRVCCVGADRNTP